MCAVDFISYTPFIVSFITTKWNKIGKNRENFVRQNKLNKLKLYQKNVIFHVKIINEHLFKRRKEGKKETHKIHICIVKKNIKNKTQKRWFPAFSFAVISISEKGKKRVLSFSKFQLSTGNPSGVKLYP